MGSRPGARNGFTLIEVVVALSILAMVAGSITVAFRMAARSIGRGEEAVRSEVRRRALLGTIERSFRNAFPLPLPEEQEPWPWFRGEPGSVRFLSASPDAATPGGAFRLLDFREGVSAGGERGLLLTESAPFRRDAGTARGGDGASRVVFPGASGVTFFYVSGFTEDGAMQTENEWDGAEKKRLPVAVGIEFSVEGETGRPRIVVPLPVGMNQLPDTRPPLDSGPVG